VQPICPEGTAQEPSQFDRYKVVKVLAPRVTFPPVFTYPRSTGCWEGFAMNVV
jgi:hypothetical protein